MAGLPENEHELPEIDGFAYDERKIIESYLEKMGNETSLTTCAVCGMHGFCTDFVTHELMPFLEHEVMNIFKFNQNEKIPNAKYAHYFQHNEHTWKLIPEAIENNEKINLCKLCNSRIETLKRVKDPNDRSVPLPSIAFGDWGRIPSDLPPLTPLEKLCISKMIPFANIIKLKDTHGANQNAIKGHFLTIPIDNSEIEKTLVDILPRFDLPQYILLVFIGAKDRYGRIIPSFFLPLDCPSFF